MSTLAQAKARVAALKENPDVNKALEKLQDDPGAILTAKLHTAHKQLLDAEEHVAKLEAASRAEQEPPHKRAKLTGLEDFNCDFGASEGKGNKSLIGQRETLVKLYQLAHTKVVAAVDSAQDAFAWCDAELEEIRETLEESRKEFVNVARELVIAHEHGWAVVKALRGTAYVRDDQERKALKEAIKTAKVCSGPSTKSAKPTKPEAGSAPAAVATVLARDRCKKCGEVGHWAKDCTKK